MAKDWKALFKGIGLPWITEKKDPLCFGGQSQNIRTDTECL